MSVRKRVLAVAGTRPDALKLAPVLAAMRDDPKLDASLVVTGQHAEILGQVLSAFDLKPVADLELMRPGQSLAALTAGALTGLDPVIERLRPDALLVQGDTTTTFAAALAGFYARVPVVHVEAGLRTFDLDRPFPEEANRKLVTQISALHLAPTLWARGNLLAEGVDPARILVTGNTVVDALQTFLARPFRPRTPGLAEAMRAANGKHLVTVTTHRRENWGRPQVEVARAIGHVARAHAGAVFVVPMHPNPAVRASLEPELKGLPNVHLLEPLPYAEMVHVLARSRCALTDSGGIQEEACALGVPILVLRELTERPEGVEAGIAKLVGTSQFAIVAHLTRLLLYPGLHARMSGARGVFGDGRASERTVAAVKALLRVGPAEVSEYVPETGQKEEVA